MRKQSFLRIAFGVIAVCVAVYLILKFTGVVREDFTVNPFPTLDDIESVKNGKPSQTMQSLFAYAKAIPFTDNEQVLQMFKGDIERALAFVITMFMYDMVPGKTPGDRVPGPMNPAMRDMFNKVKAKIDSYTTQPTFRQAFKDLIVITNPKPVSDSQIDEMLKRGDYKQNPPSHENVNSVMYQAYKYLFGEEGVPFPIATPPAPTAVPTPPLSAAPLPQTIPTTRSTELQPLMMAVPQPCSAAFKSIPGGAVDVQCFN